MWRSLFLALGIMLLIVGVECLLIDSATFGNVKTETVQVSNGWFQEPKTVEVVKGGKEVTPPDWIPWSFLFSGGVTLLYSFTLPARLGKSG